MEKLHNILQKNQYVWRLIKKVRGVQRYCQYQWADKVSFRSLPSSTALMLLAKKGNVAAIETLLIEGEDINGRDSRNRTALHYAIKCGQPQAAACLLAYGADHTLMDEQGNLPLSLDYTNAHMLHALRQRYRRFIKISDKRKRDEKALVAPWLEDLENNGIVKISGLIGSNELTEMQREFRDFIKNIDQKMAEGDVNFKYYDEEEHWWPKDNAYVTNNAFKYSKQLINLCCNPKLLEVAWQYYGRDTEISRGVGMRYLSGGRNGNDQFHWHHDMSEKRLKMMVLLTDIGEDDQTMSYALGTHKILLPYDKFFNNAYSLEYAAKHVGEIKILNTIGKAGDIFLFDTNGAHRGNRRDNAKIRDAFFVEFSDDTSDMWGGDIPKNYFIDNPISGLNPFISLMSVRKKWDIPVTRYYCNWVTNIPYADRWLRKSDTST